MLIQEEFSHDPFKMLIGCIMLNQTSNKNVRRVIYSFFERWPTPNSIIDESDSNIRDHIRSLGFYNRRTNIIKKFSKQWLKNEHNNITELYGIGKYANDSYEIFINRNLNVNPSDKILIKYLNGDYINQ